MKTLTRRFTTICLLGAALSGCGGGGGGGGDGGNENQPPANDRTWGTAAPIDTDNGNNSGPAIAMDANGNAIAVWTQDDGTRYNIWANRYVAGVGWGTAAPIESDDGNNLGTGIAMDANGNAIAMWTQQNGTQLDAWTNRYTVGVGWGTEAPLKMGDGFNYGYNLAMSANGDAIVVWVKSVGTHLNSLWASRYAARVGWETAVPIASDNAIPSYPQIAMDANGNAIAVWTQWGMGILPGDPNLMNYLMANRYTAGVGWGTATSISGTSLLNSMVRIAMNAGGDAIIAWGTCNDNSSSCTISVQPYVTGGNSWSSAGGNAPNLYSLDIAMDANGNAIVIWAQCIDADCNQHSLWAHRYLADTGPLIEPDQPIGTEAKYQFPDIAMDADGNAIIVWTQGDVTPPNILATRYVAGTGWETAAPIETNDANNSDPQIAMDASGNAVVVWTQRDGERGGIWANEFK